ncbi:MAG: glycosyltransferase family 39 protein [Abditibacteriota bacterium]|nr:glycosyltransferase family 39 protein [Abditibacteriota bacterium]
MKKYAHIFIYAFIALVSLGIMIYHSGDFSLWNDDMAMLGMCSKGFTFREMIRSAVENDRMPVLYHILFFLFNKFAVGDFAFKFSSMIFTAAGIFTCGLLGKRLGNTIVGTITACVSAYQICSPFGDFLRPYAMLFFVMSVVFLLYAKRFEERGNETIKTQIILGVIYGIAVNLHYTAILVLFVLFITDLVMILSKKSKPVAFVSYIVCALMFIPWFIIGIIVPAIKGNSYMAARVAEDTVPLTRGQMKKRLLDMKSLTPFIPGLAVYCLVLLAALKNRLTDKDRICGVFIVAFVINFVIVTILGRDPALYLSSRFYVPVMPVLAVCMGLSVSWIVNSIHLPRIAGVAVAFTAVAICLFCVHKSYLPGSRFL